MPVRVYEFGPFQLDPAARRLTKGVEVLPLSARQFDLLHLMVAHAGQVLSKDSLIEAAWAGVAVTDNSLEQAVSGLRRVLAAYDAGPFIETQARRGYRFVPDVRRTDRREPVEALEALLAPHRAWIEGRAALETLERSQVIHAREVFERVLEQVPDQASAHVGLANAGVMQFEMTRAEIAPDTAALAMAADHAREACRLDPRYGEAWATLGFVLDRAGQRTDALAASRRAVSLEADNWRHHVRLAYVSWGEERLREARRALALLPGFPLAHWLAATVYVARQALDEAERELQAGLAAQAAPTHSRFTSVALHWLLGLVMVGRGDDAGAQRHFELELANEGSGQLYARECCANTWYAIGAQRLRQGDHDGAVEAFDETLQRVPRHPMARVARHAATVGLELGMSSSHRARGAHPGEVQKGAGAGSQLGVTTVAQTVAGGAPAELALAEALAHSLRGEVTEAALIVDVALQKAADGRALWLLPVEPLLRPAGDARWASPLDRLRNRAA